MNATQPFIEKALDHLSKKAIVETGGRSVDFEGLLARIYAFADLLTKKGFKAQDRVLLLIPNGIEMTVCLLAAMYKGGVPVLLESGFGDEVFLSRVKLVNPPWSIVHSKLKWVNSIPGAKTLLRRLDLHVPPTPPMADKDHEIIVNGSFLDHLVAGGTDLSKQGPTNCKPDDDTLMVFTGGTASLPKCVRISIAGFYAFLSNIETMMGEVTINHLMADTPPQVLYAIYFGRTAYINKGGKRKKAAYLKSLINEGTIDSYFGSPYIWMEILESMGENMVPLPETLKTVLLGSAPATRDFLTRFLDWVPPVTQVLIIYGMTESGIISLVDARIKSKYKGEGDLVGETLDNIKVEIINPNENTGIGEMLVFGPSLYTGYLGQTSRKPEEGLHTGDLGKFVEVNGRRMIALMGRQKGMIIRRGVNIYPLPFEDAIKRTVKDAKNRFVIRECALIGLWDPLSQDEVVVCCAQTFERFSMDEPQLEKQIDAVCGQDAKPDHHVFLAEIPVVGRQNKVDKQALREHCAQLLGRGLESLIGGS